MSTAGDSTELFGPLSELACARRGWKLLDGSTTSGPRDSLIVSVLMRQEVRSEIVLRIAPKLNLRSIHRLKAKGILCADIKSRPKITVAQIPDGPQRVVYVCILTFTIGKQSI